MNDTLGTIPKEDLKIEDHKAIRALVRFLARKAAEKDYKELIEVLKSKKEYSTIFEEEDI